MKYLLTLLLLFSCSKHETKRPLSISEKIQAKADLYKALHRGWAHDKCDSLGFTALAKLSGGASDADIYQAEGKAGQWFRSPEHDCYDKLQSASDISKDMFVMLLPYLFTKGDKQNLNEIYDYGKKFGFVMGRGPYSRTVLTPELIYTIQLMINRVEEAKPIEELFKSGYEKHLDVINFMTKAMMINKLNDIDYEQLRRYVEAQPRNALFQALYHKLKDGNQEKAIAILSDETLFPSDRLPSAKDRCDQYLWERDEDQIDWKPCGTNKVHDGTDFLIAAYVAGLI